MVKHSRRKWTSISDSISLQNNEVKQRTLESQGRGSVKRTANKWFLLWLANQKISSEEKGTERDWRLNSIEELENVS